MNTPDLATLGAELSDLGVLIGLLTKTNSSISPNIIEWFADPEKGLQNGFNWPNLKPVAQSFLGKSQNPIEGIGGGPFNEEWYPLSVDDGEGGSRDSGFYLVQKTVGNNALLGIGLHRSFQMVVGDDECSIDPFVFVPIFQMPAVAGASPIFAIDTNGPVELGISITSTKSFLGDYNGAIFVSSFNFSSNKPDITFLLSKSGGSFVNVPSITKTDVFNAILTLKPVLSLLDSEVLPDPSLMDLNWGTLLNAVGWLNSSASPFTVGNISIADAPGALKDYVVNIVTKAFNEFLDGKKVFNLISSPVGDESDDKDETPKPTWKIGLVVQDNRYGINIQVNDVCLKQDPLVNLQLGALTADETDWITEAGGEEPTGLGLNFFILSGTPSTGIKFDPQFEALSIGLDISKIDEQPLFDINGYSLKGAQLRGYFSTLQDNAWGVAAALNGIALPLGPASSGDGGSVPQTLLSSAEVPEGEADAKPVVNPEFSLLTAYLNNFYLQLFDAEGQPTEIISIPMQKAFGPVALRSVGIGWKDSPDYQLLFQLDGGLNLNALKLNLDKLTVGIPVKTPGDTANYSLGLDGFDLSFTSGAVSLAGGFIKDDSVTPAQYNGAVAIQAASWGITALGSFASVEGSPSLFIFGVLSAALGGPPVFFVTAIAVGFGYNRKVIMPAIDQVQNFPFVKAAVEPDLFSGDDPNEVLTSISQYIPPEMGQYWFAAGVKFTSFELLNSFALLILQFGNRCEIDILGLSTLQLPKQSSLKPYVNAQMAIKATFDPDEGILAVQAQLTDNSFVIDPACKITGGFAYYSWFKGQHEGDFVVTLGGYHPNFVVPAHYPTVPRLAFNWNFSDNITISGEAYFALTPSCIMAGGKLSLIYSNGNLQAWFKAFADFLIEWKPFHYDIAIGITVGVSYRIKILFIHKTISVELGVSVHIWGPEFAGNARVSLWIISFTIGFGNQNTDKPNANIEWGDFEKYFLPGADTEEKKETKLRSFAAEPLKDDASAEVLTINVNSGLKDKYKAADGSEYLIVDPGAFAFNTSSAVPATKITFAAGPNGAADKPADIAGNAFGIRPVGAMTLSGDASKQTVKLTKQNASANGYTSYSLNGWDTDADVKSVPQALWATTKGSGNPSADVVPNITSGLLNVKPPLPNLTGPDAFPLSNLAFTTVDTFNLPLNAKGQLTQVTLNTAGSIDQIKNINSAATKQMRNNIFAALTDLGSAGIKNNDLAVMGSAPQNIFQGSPMLANNNHKPLLMATKMLSVPKPKLRANSPVQAHQLKATITKYKFGQDKAGGSILRGGKFATSAFKDQNTSNLKNGAAKVTTVNLVPGMLQVWQLGSVKSNGNLRHNGSLPLRMILFDDNLEIIADNVINNRRGGNLNIDNNATKMCLQALDHSELNPTLSGWHQDSQLSLVNPKYLVGKNCMVRSRNMNYVGKKQYKYDTGLVKGRAVVLKNKTTIQEGDAVKGWVETRFTANIKQVFVLAREEWNTDNNLEFNLNVRLIYTDSEGSRLAQALSPSSTGINGRELWAGFTIPEGVNYGEHFSIWVEAEGDDKIQLAGVAGCEEAISEWTHGLSDELAGTETALSLKNKGLRSSVGFKSQLIF